MARMTRMARAIRVIRAICGSQLGQHGMLQLIQAFARDGGNLHQVQAVFLAPALELLDFLRVGDVHFGGDDDLGFLRQVWIVFGKFRVDSMILVDRIAIVGAGDIDQMQKHAGSFDVPEKLNPEPMSLVGALDKSGNIGDNECFVAIDGDDPELGFERRERIIRDLGTRRRDAGDQRRFPDVGIAHKAHVCQKLQFKTKCFFFS